MSEKTKFWILLGLLIISLGLVWWINTNLSQTFVSRFVR
jgi:hypothetical protein